MDFYSSLMGLIGGGVVLLVYKIGWPQVRRMLFVDVGLGLYTTLKTFWRRKTTVQFPEEQLPRSPRNRGLLALRRYPNGEERCIACQLCQASCPALAITIESSPREDLSRRATRFDIDMFKCIHCGLCEEACPVDAIVLTSEIHYVTTVRGQNILTKDKLLAVGDACEVSIARDRQKDAPFR